MPACSTGRRRLCADAPLYLGGTDFADLAADGRIRTVAGFTDAAPAA